MGMVSSSASNLSKSDPSSAMTFNEEVDKKINFILLKSIGKTAQPNKNKINLMDLKKFSNLLINRNF